MPVDKFCTLNVQLTFVYINKLLYFLKGITVRDCRNISLSKVLCELCTFSLWKREGYLKKIFKGGGVFLIFLICCEIFEKSLKNFKKFMRAINLAVGGNMKITNLFDGVT